MLRDICEFTDERRAYADEVRRRWGGLPSYRYLGRKYASMDPGDVVRIEIVDSSDLPQGVSAHVMFLARGNAGPFRVEAEPFAGATGAVGVRVALHDEGNGDKAITADSYPFRTETLR